MRIDRSKLFTALFASLMALASATAAHASDFTIGGTLSGLITGRSITLLDNGADALKVTANGKFTFTTALATGAAYKVTVSVQPAGETCAVTGGSGTVGSANVTTVVVACKANDYSIGGKLTGLITGRSVTLLDNGANALVVTANGTFTFTTKLASATAYKVTVGTQASGEICTVTAGSGTVVAANVTSVVVTCTANDYSIGGKLSGLNSGASVTLLDNGANALVVTANGTFTFTTKLASGTAYKVTVGTQPSGGTCTVTDGSGTVGAANVTTVVVTCTASDYTIGGTLSGLTSASVTLLDNGANALVVTANGTFTFTTPLASGTTYDVTVGTQPSGETCTVTNGSGTVGSAKVTNVAVACSSGTGGGSGAYWIPYSATPVASATPAGKTGLFLIPSDKLASAPPPKFLTTDTTQLLGIGTQVSETGGVAAYSPQVMMYADTDTAGTTKIYGVTLAGTSTFPTPVQIGSLALPSSQQICQFSTAETDVAQPDTLFALIQVGTSTQCLSGAGTYEVVHYTDSATTAPVVVSLNTTTIYGIYQNAKLTGLFVFDSTTASLDLYADDTFTSPKQEITGLSGAIYVAGVLDVTTLSTSEIFLSATTTGGSTSLYRIDGSTLAATEIQNVMTGNIGAAVQDDNNLYYEVLTPGTDGSTILTFNQVALTGGTPKLLYTAPTFVAVSATGITSYQLIGSNDSLVVFEYAFEPFTSGVQDPTKATATLYTLPVGTTTTTPDKLATYPAGNILEVAFLAAPSGSELSAEVLFASVRNTTGSIEAPTIALSAVSIPLNGATAPAPIANSVYLPLAIISARLTDSVWLVTDITDTNGGWGGGTAKSVDVATLAASPFTTTGGGDYVFSPGFSGEIEAISSNNIAIGFFENEAAVVSSGATFQEIGVAADLTSNFLYPIAITNTHVVPY